MSLLTNESLYLAIKNHRPELMSQLTSNEAIIFLKDHVMKTNSSKFDSYGEEKETNVSILENRVRGFLTTLHKKWVECFRVAQRFESKNQSWLNMNFNLTFSDEVRTNTGVTRGRPKIMNIEEASEKTKKRRTEELRLSTEPELLYQATIHSLNVEQKRSAAYIVKQATQFSPRRPLTMRRLFLERDKKEPVPLTGDQALAMYVDLELTRSKYEKLRQLSKNYNADIYPPYNYLIDAKKKCYPNKIDIGEYGMRIPLQELLDHTCSRICETLTLQDDQFDNFSSVTFYWKWGCDGTSGQNEYMQLFQKDGLKITSEEFSEKNLFMFSLVPLKLVGLTQLQEKLLLWENPRPSSTRFCRPLKCLYIKETKESTKDEVEKVETEITALKASEVEIDGNKLSICHHLIFTMLDTKVINALTDTSSQTCYICGCLPSQMNNLDLARSLTIRENNLKYGLSTLHAWLKFLECILHIAYKLEYQKTSLRGATEADREEIEERKENVKENLWREIGIKVDRVAPGSGTSNTGNVARRFFSDPAKAAEATGVDQNLIRRIATILQAMSSGLAIDDEKFDEYTRETASLYIEHYHWYNMPPSVHKILLHGSQAIKYAILPIGQLSEEAQESRNKDYKRLRKSNTAKISRLRTSRDLLNALLISSDPVIAMHRPLPKKEKKELSAEVLSLLRIEEESERNANVEVPSIEESEDDEADDFF